MSEARDPREYPDGVADDALERLLRHMAGSPLVNEDEVDGLYQAGLVGLRHDRRGSLSRCELAVVLLLSHGLTVAMVADVLGKSVHTINRRARGARLSLGAKNETHLVALALRHQLIP